MKILIVDDSAFARSRLASIFIKAGHSVTEADSGKMGLMLYEKIKPDIVTVDLLMPEMDGMDFIRELLSVHSEARIAVISADIQESTRDEVIGVGAALFLSKTCKGEDILRAIEDLAIRSQPIVFTMTQRDTFSEMMNIAMGKAAHALSALIQRRVLLRVPMFEVLNYSEFITFLDRNIASAGVMVKQPFGGSISGSSSLVFPQHHAAKLVNELISAEAKLDRLSSAEQTILSEVGNVVLNSAISVLGDIMKTRLKVRLPLVFLNEPNKRITEIIVCETRNVEQVIILASNLTIAREQIECYLVFALSFESSIALLRHLGG